MTERERLISMLAEMSCKCNDTECEECEYNKENNCQEKMQADHLLSNGVIVPPCKVGDTVYVDEDTWQFGMALYYDNRFIHSKYFLVGEIVGIIKTKKQLLIKIRVLNSIHTRYRHKRHPASAIGKTVFLTKEEVEKALKERSEGK